MKEIIKIREKINKIEKKINEGNSWHFEKIIKIEKPLARVIIKKKEDNCPQNKIRNKRGEITTDIIDKNSQKKLLQLVIHKQLDSLEEMDKFLKIYTLPKLNQEEINNLNR